MPRRARDAEAMPRVGAALRTLRESAGFSVATMAAICGVNRKTWYRREDLGIVPPAKELAAFARSVDPRCPLRAKARILQAAGFLTDREADAMLTASGLLMERPKRQRSHQGDRTTEETR
jgi:transcriptional regulator with XRE-family HTH domain